MSRNEAIVDLCAGPGGWDVAARRLGLDPLGIELDDSACATRDAAGLRTLQGDIALLDPADFAPCAGVIASPPCPTFSSGGRGAGRLLTDVIVRCMAALAASRDTRVAARAEAYDVLEPAAWTDEQKKATKRGREPDRAAAQARARRDADMSLLVVEPLRWVLTLKPDWVACEQVPEVLGLWAYMAQLLGAVGYGTWTGELSAEQYGVPQTRSRAILIARRGAVVHPPTPTHQRYDHREPRWTESRFTFDGEVHPWISMADALGLPEGEVPAPAPTVTAGGSATGGVEVFASVGARRRAERAVSYDRRQSGGDGTPVGPRHLDQPAPTITATGLASGRDVWRLRTGQLSQMGGGRLQEYSRPIDHPAPTVLTTARCGWVFDRLATTVQGDSRIAPPGHRDREGDEAQFTDGTVRVTLEQAAALQSFPDGYPWQGGRSQQFTQVGNAVPPLLAEHVLRAVADHASARNQGRD